jgi:hypothetical protein
MKQNQRKNIKKLILNKATITNLSIEWVSKIKGGNDPNIPVPSEVNTNCTSSGKVNCLGYK